MQARLKYGQRLASSMRLVGCIGRADEPNRPLPGIRATTPSATKPSLLVFFASVAMTVLAQAAFTQLVSQLHG